jgi:hypothetical protein
MNELHRGRISGFLRRDFAGNKLNAARALFVSPRRLSGGVRPITMNRFLATTTVLLAALASSQAAPGDSADAQATQGATRDTQHATRHWSFVAPVRPAIPAVKNTRWVRNPIDAFVLARLERENVTPSPAADRRTLIRRLHLDLLGLPPTPEQVRAFLDDNAPDASERLVDSLLASPHFGERWARHWLDLARYADSSGYQIDRPRPFAWLYRDWVINAINDDLPFDQFTIEQLAGDLLPQATVAQKTAAGFHRLTLMNHEDGAEAEEFRCKAKVDRVGTTGTVWLGLTVGCAECHNHKYDPISQREFYQLYAFFNNSQEVDVPAPESDDPARFEREKKAWAAEQTRLKNLLAQHANARDPRATEVKRQLARHRRAEPKNAEARAESFLERAAPARANIHLRGDFLRKGEEVATGTPAILPALQPRGPDADRLDLARWLVAPGHPLTARVAVNHVWQHLFGRGLVNTPGDFGTRGEPPSHPELLDWLAASFSSPRSSQREESLTESRIDQSLLTSAATNLGWSRKALIKLIVTSAAYRQSSRHRPELAARDPQNVLLARQNRLRVESEIVRDLSLAAGGLLNDDIGGPSFRPHLPDDVKKLGNAGAFTWTDTEGPEKYRRGLYIYAQRTVPYPASMTLDQADSAQSCPRRERSNTPLQALTLLNHGIFVECAQGLARRMIEGGARDPRARIENAFELCVSRQPTPSELDRLEKLHLDQVKLACASPEAAAKLARPGAPVSDTARPETPSTSRVGDRGSNESTQVASLVALSQVLLNLDEFLTRE